MAHPEYPPTGGDERAQLERHLDFAREVLCHKAEGLADELGGKRLGKTRTSVFGLVKHMTYVEMGWFHVNMGGLEIDLYSGWMAQFDVARGERGAEVLERYRAACAKSREICAEFELDGRSRKAHFDGSHPTLRWVYLHMIDETARHNGHLDIYRELLDGAVDAKY